MKKLLLSAMLSLGFLVNPVMAQYTDQEQKSSEMLKKIQTEYPNLNVSQVTYLPEIQLYELKVKNNEPLSYTDENVNYFILNGQIVDPKRKINVSQQREIVNTQDFFNSLPFNEAIQAKFGNGERHIAIFTDPDCPYCRQTDQAIYSQMGQDNLTISYFMNPLAIPGHEQAPLKAKKIWCSPNKSEAWKNWMITNVLPDNPGTCDNPVEKNMKLSEENGFTLTPIVIFDNGIVWRGKIDPAQIREILTKYPLDLK